MKKYLKVTITTHEGKTIDNPLMLSEVGLISKIAQDNASVNVVCVECSKEQYKQIFG